MYMKSNNGYIADLVPLPETSYLLDYVRPEFLFLRVLARSIIMWKSIKPSKEWVERQLPPHLFGELQLGLKAPQDDSQRQAYFYLLAGACFSMGLKYAGSRNPVAFAVLLQYCDYFVEIRTQISHNAAERANKYAAETCMCMAFLSISLVMVSTGNLDILRRLRKLHGRPVADITYGSQMALHQAMGFLFLGGGTSTLGTGNKAIAALIISLYPLFPLTAGDNRYHLQALRHLYVLAVENRCFLTRDIESQMLCQTPVRVDVVGKQGPLFLTTPCQLPEFTKIKKISIFDPHYHPVTLDLATNPRHFKALKTSLCSILVKRKITAPVKLTFFLSFSFLGRKLFPPFFNKESPLSLSKLPLSGEIVAFESRVKELTSDPALLAFVRVFCDGAVPDSALYISMVEECLSGDKTAVFPLIVLLSKGLDSGALPSVADLKIILALNEVTGKIPALERGTTSGVLSQALVEKIVLRIERKLEELEGGETAESKLFLKMLANYFSGMTVSLDSASQKLVSTMQTYLAYHNFPDVDSKEPLF